MNYSLKFGKIALDVTALKNKQALLQCYHLSFDYTGWHLTITLSCIFIFSSQCLEENLTQDDIKREFNRRHTSITSGAGQN